MFNQFIMVPLRSSRVLSHPPAIFSEKAFNIAENVRNSPNTNAGFEISPLNRLPKQIHGFHVQRSRARGGTQARKPLTIEKTNGGSILVIAFLSPFVICAMTIQLNFGKRRIICTGAVWLLDLTASILSAYLRHRNYVLHDTIHRHRVFGVDVAITAEGILVLRIVDIVRMMSFFGGLVSVSH